MLILWPLGWSFQCAHLQVFISFFFNIKTKPCVVTIIFTLIISMCACVSVHLFFLQYKGKTICQYYGPLDRWFWRFFSSHIMWELLCYYEANIFTCDYRFSKRPGIALKLMVISKLDLLVVLRSSHKSTSVWSNIQAFQQMYRDFVMYILHLIKSFNPKKSLLNYIHVFCMITSSFLVEINMALKEKAFHYLLECMYAR